MNHPFSMKKDSVIDELKTNVKSGLSTNEAEARLAKYGPNSLGEEKKTPLWKSRRTGIRTPRILR